MNLLFLIPKFPPSVGGAATNYKILIDELQKNGCVREVYVLTSWVKRKAKISEKHGKVRILRLIYPRAGFGKESFIKRGISFILNQFSICFFLPIVVYLKHIDILHFHSTYCHIKGKYENFLFICLLRILKLKHSLVMDVQDLGWVPKRRVDVHKIICASENIFYLMRGVDNNAKKCVHLPIPFRRPELLINDKVNDFKKFEPYILFIGNIEELKGIYELINAFELLGTQYKKYNLVLVGPNGLGNSFTSKIKQNHKIIYVGPQPHTRIPNIIYCSEVVVLPSKSEGMPRVCLEAISLGKKVILPPGIPEFNRWCPEFVLSKVTPEEVALKIKEVLKDSKIPNYPLERHKVTTVVDKLLTVYLQLLHDH